ncbi:MAG: hypothetical protein ACRC2H_08370 [Silanimonas sp.]
MATAHIAVRSAVVAALSAPPALANGNIYVGRRRTLSKADTRALIVRLAGSDSNPGAIRGAPVDWRTGVVIEAYARESTGDPEQAVWDLHQQVFDRLQADSTLAGAVDDIATPSFGEADREDEDDALAAITALYPVLHRTTANTLVV